MPMLWWLLPLTSEQLFAGYWGEHETNQLRSKNKTQRQPSLGQECADLATVDDAYVPAIHTMGKLSIVSILHCLLLGVLLNN